MAFPAADGDSAKAHFVDWLKGAIAVTGAVGLPTMGFVYVLITSQIKANGETIEKHEQRLQKVEQATAVIQNDIKHQRKEQDRQGEVLDQILKNQQELLRKVPDDLPERRR